MAASTKSTHVDQTTSAAAPTGAIYQPVELLEPPAPSAAAIRRQSGLTAEPPAVAGEAMGGKLAFQDSEPRRTVSHPPETATAVGGAEVARVISGEGAETWVGQPPATPRPRQPADVPSASPFPGVAHTSWVAPATLAQGDEGSMVPAGKHEWIGPTPPQPDQSGDLAGLPIHPVPLEAAWPVERMEVPSTATPRSLALDTATMIAPQSVEADQPFVIMWDLPPARSTDSAVEVIAPRRPRPTGAPSPGSAGAARVASEAMILEDAAPVPVQRQEDDPHGLPDRTKAISAPPQSTGTIKSLASRDEDMIETAIGPLPADLWQLLEQQPPGRPEARAESGPSTAPLREALAPEHESTQPAVPAQPPRAVVQRQAEAPAVVDTVADSTESKSETPGSAASPDTNELARRVYAEIRRRLAVEWERTRRL